MALQFEQQRQQQQQQQNKRTNNIWTFYDHLIETKACSGNKLYLGK